MKAFELIALFERMAAERWAYEWGAAREGCVDCSGAFVWAFGQFGQTIAHGSNSIARSNIRQMRDVSQARPGFAVFKRRLDGQEPEKYKNDGWGNFYHIGLMAADGRRVLNAKGEAYGFCADSLSGATGAAGWEWAMPLPGVDYGEGSDAGMEETLYRAKVSTEKDPLRVRAAPRTGAILGHVPRGRTVDVLDTGLDPDWPRIRYGELAGYASGAYLTRVASPLPSDDATGGQGPEASPFPSDDAPPGSGETPHEADGDTVTISLTDAQAIYEAISEAQRLLSNTLDRD